MPGHDSCAEKSVLMLEKLRDTGALKSVVPGVVSFLWRSTKRTLRVRGFVLEESVVVCSMDECMRAL